MVGSPLHLAAADLLLGGFHLRCWVVYDAISRDQKPAVGLDLEPLRLCNHHNYPLYACLPSSTTCKGEQDCLLGALRRWACPAISIWAQQHWGAGFFYLFASRV
jgi:hypothetical protein